MAHKDLTGGDIHQMNAGSYADFETLTGTSFSANDVGKVYKLTDEKAVYELIDTTPTFRRIRTGYAKRIQTTDATETALFTFDASTLTDYIIHVSATVMAFVSGGGNGAGYESSATFKNDSGTVSIIGSTTDHHNAEDTAGWDVQIESSGTNILVNVTGQAATTINWQGDFDVRLMKDS